MNGLRRMLALSAPVRLYIPAVGLQLFKFTLSDQSLKPTRQDRRGIWDLNE